MYLTYDELKKDFLLLEKMRYEIVDSYILGNVIINQVDDFKTFFMLIRSSINTLVVTEENVYKVAKIKSKMQHYYTEILEDDELLTMAYKNSC